MNLNENKTVPPGGKLLLWGGLACPIAFYALVILFAPVDVFDRFPMLKELSDNTHAWLISRAPFINIYKHAQSTIYPQLAMLASALAIHVVVFIAVTFCTYSFVYYRYILAAHRARPPMLPNARLAQLVGLPVMGPLCFWAFYCLKGDPSFATGLTTHWRIGYVFMSTCAIAFTAGIGLWPMSMRLLLADIFTGTRR